MVAGGDENTISEEYGFIGGGFKNSVDGAYATVAGGYKNLALSNYATITGGFLNAVTGRFASVVGGARNNARGRFSLAAGYKADAKGDYTAAFGFSGEKCATTQANQIAFCADSVSAAHVRGWEFALRRVPSTCWVGAPTRAEFWGATCVRSDCASDPPYVCIAWGSCRVVRVALGASYASVPLPPVPLQWP